MSVLLSDSDKLSLFMTRLLPRSNTGYASNSVHLYSLIIHKCLIHATALCQKYEVQVNNSVSEMV